MKYPELTRPGHVIHILRSINENHTLPGKYPGQRHQTCKYGKAKEPELSIHAAIKIAIENTFVSGREIGY